MLHAYRLQFTGTKLDPITITSTGPQAVDVKNEATSRLFWVSVGSTVTIQIMRPDTGRPRINAQFVATDPLNTAVPTPKALGHGYSLVRVPSEDRKEAVVVGPAPKIVEPPPAAPKPAPAPDGTPPPDTKMSTH